MSDQRPYCLDLKRQAEIVDRLLAKGYARTHPLVSNPLSRALVIKRLAERARHTIPTDGPCAKCKAKEESDGSDGA